MKRAYEKPAVERIDFQVEEPLMTGQEGSVDDNLGESWDYSDTPPWER